MSYTNRTNSTLQGIDYVPKRLLRLESSGSMPTVTTWWLTQSGESTVVHYEFEGHPGDRYGAPAGNVEGQIKHRLAAQFTSFKTYVEKQES